MEKHISKKFFAGILALSAGFILAACDPVSAVPTNYNHSIITSTDGEIDLDGNNLGSLYDSITSERNSKIVEKILAQIAEKKFGTYAEFLEASSDASKVANYVANHKEFFGEDATEAAARFETFERDIKERISEYFYNEITSGSYNDDLGRFSEEKLYNAHRYELYDLHELDKTVAEDLAVIENKFFVTKELDKNLVFDSTEENYLKGVYHNLEEGKRGYVEEKVYPDILRNKLVEDYIYRNNASSLGRAYGRKVNYVKVSYDGESLLTGKLMEEFAKANIEAATADEQINFELVANAVKGFSTFGAATSFVDAIVPLSAEGTGALYNLLKATYGNPATYANPTDPDDGNVVKIEYAVDGENNFKYMGAETIVLIPEGRYYKETKLGKILEEYKKAIKAEKEGRFPADENKAALDSFTSDGKTKEYGLLQKLISLAKEDYTTEGWFVKNGGLTELPSAIRDRLFNIKVATSFDVTNENDANFLVDENSAETMGAYEYPKGDKTKDKLTRLPYLRKIYGKKVVLPSKSLSYEKDNFNYIYHDIDAKAFYICEVLEAPSTAKLNANSEDAYKKADNSVDTAKIENVSRQVAKILGTKDSYIKDAYTEYLNKYEFTFFDTSLYDYFKSEYPDLDQFDD